MTKILAIETATEACSAALLINDEIQECFEIAPRRHTDLILPMVAELLADAELSVQNLSAVAFGAGPGSFTGVRVATSIAQGIAMAHDLPVVPLSCLAMLAIGGAEKHNCSTTVPVMDARRQEVYFAVYQVNIKTKVAKILEPDAISTPGNLPLPNDSNCVVIGTGVKAYREQILSTCANNIRVHDNPLYPSASNGLRQARDALWAGACIAPEFAKPIYLRHPV
ncbi:MAG TPA: tRNA (adenosine(37)-N6)-threonylcarbamoyltransferase complex dimerization subunit type 1 TsaB [Gammaproteobacteria bacterium]|nr:tRNA (adenosine(37)-N6)-threonylcarbamoyltransferase complex dimerization subunit type 1 TsaB [Gammaproteobacteria bacterium]|tara:strand:+ start:739 stop:1410 length:672 start_codon:yes stop_codon:yes gene_type:complete